MFDFAEKVSMRLAQISMAAARILLTFVVVILLVQVGLRYIFSAALPWPEEASRYAMIWVVLLVGNVLIRDQELITVDFLDRLWPRRVLIYRDFSYRLLLLLLMGLLFYEGVSQAVHAIRMTTTAMQISWFWPYLSVPVGAALMFLQMFFLIIKDLAKARKRGQHNE